MISDRDIGTTLPNIYQEMGAGGSIILDERLGGPLSKFEAIDYSHNASLPIRSDKLDRLAGMIDVIAGFYQLKESNLLERPYWSILLKRDDKRKTFKNSYSSVFA